MALKRLKKTTSSKWEPRHWSVVETDNFGGDCPAESFLIRKLRKETCERIADLINEDRGAKEGNTSRYFKVEKDTYDAPYKLEPGFEP